MQRVHDVFFKCLNWTRILRFLPDQSAPQKDLLNVSDFMRSFC